MISNIQLGRKNNHTSSPPPHYISNTMVSSSPQGLYILPKSYHLTGIDNYKIWAFHLKNVLQYNGLYKPFHHSRHLKKKVMSKSEVSSIKIPSTPLSR